MRKQGTWKHAETKESNIVALMTKVNDLEAKLQSSSSTGKHHSNSLYFTLDDCHMKKNGKSNDVDGKSWHWCPKNKQDGVYDSLYVTHTSNKYDKWLERNSQWKKKNPLTSVSSDTPRVITLKTID